MAALSPVWPSEITIWTPDSRRIVYVSNRNGPFHVFTYDFPTSTETQLTSSSDSDAAPRFSPDGNRIAFLRGGKGLWVYDLEKKQEFLLSQANHQEALANRVRREVFERRRRLR